MFEKYTESAIKAITLAQEEARQMNHKYVDLQHLLLGLIGQRHGIAAKALQRSGLTLRKTRRKIELYIGRGTGYVASKILFTSRSKKVLKNSFQKRKDFNQNLVETEHLLLGLIFELPGTELEQVLNIMDINMLELEVLILQEIIKKK